MKPIHIIRHEDWINAGRLIEVLEQRNLPYKLIAIDQNDSVPDDIDNMSGLAFLGGTMSVNDSFTWINDELNLILKAREKHLPVLGHCFGSQLISKALGGEVKPMPEKEIGWHSIKAADNPTASEWLNTVPNIPDILIWHHDEFSIPEGASPLYESKFCKNQAFVINNMLATVAHIEVTVNMLNQWLDVYGYDIDPNGGSMQSISDIKDNIESKVSNMHRLTDSFYDRWLQTVVNEIP